MSGLLRFGIKAGIMASAVYITVDKGVWKDNETTGQLYDDLKKQMAPYAKPVIDQLPFEIPKLPSTGDLASSTKTAWNKAVMASCLFLVELPGTTWGYIKQWSSFTYKKINEELNALRDVENKHQN